MGHCITIAGEGCRLELRVEGYQFPAATDPDDANWLVARVDLIAGVSGRFSARYDGYLRTDDLARFRDQLRPAVESLSGRATLDDLESQVGVDVRLSGGKGTFSVFVRDHVGARLEYNDAVTDQSYLAGTLSDLDALLRQFPVRMNTE